MLYIKKTYIIWKKTKKYKIQNGRRLFEKLYISTQKKQQPKFKKYTNIFDISCQLLSRALT